MRIMGGLSYRAWRLSRIVEWSWRPGLALQLCLFSDDDGAGGRVSLNVRMLVAQVFLRLPFRWRKPDELMEAWGFCWPWDADGTSTIHFRWGPRSKLVFLPWHPTWMRTSYLLPDGQTWIHELRPRYRVERVADSLGGHGFSLIRDIPKWERKYHYRYVLRSGVVQDVTATVRVEERERRWRWFTWLAWPRGVQRSIAVDFSGEVGERTGSWKGGTIGCGYTLLPNETPLGCLRRMERERKF